METLKKIYAALDVKLGRCPKCMRQSFAFMLAAWGLAFTVSLTANAPVMLVACMIVAIGLAGLWFSHLTAFALRAAENASTLKGGVLEESVVTDLSLQPRRHFVLNFAKNFILMAAATALPIRTVFAQAACNCPTAAPKCCYSYDGRRYVCAPSNANCCASANPWYCSSGMNCYGDHSCR